MDASELRACPMFDRAPTKLGHHTLNVVSIGDLGYALGVILYPPHYGVTKISACCIDSH